MIENLRAAYREKNREKIPQKMFDLLKFGRGEAALVEFEIYIHVIKLIELLYYFFYFYLYITNVKIFEELFVLLFKLFKLI